MSLFVAFGLSVALIFPCPFGLPVDGPVVRGYAPAGSYGGHWGIDFEVETGTPVSAAAAGRVSFAGEVAGRMSVTIDHGGGVRTSYSYLDEILVSRGRWVSAGAVVGRSGMDRGIEALHFSMRIWNQYITPVAGSCTVVPSPALALAGIR